MIKRYLLAAWNSPTLTSWAAIATSSLRLLAVTPLILTQLEEHETASWYLFSNLSFLGAIITQQVGAIFSNMLSFAMGGASDLSSQSISRRKKAEKGGKPNWDSFARAYGTLRWIQVGTAIGNFLIAGILGYFALGNLLEGVPNDVSVWAAFMVLLVTGFISTSLSNYSVALRGMNKVALNNRWTIIASLASIMAGAVTLASGGGIFWTTVAMQGISLLNLYRIRWLVRRVEDKAILGFPPLRFDRTIFAYAWPTLWRQGLVAFSAIGFLQAVGVIFSITGTAAQVGGYFLLLRLSNAVNQISQAPFAGVAPRFSRRIAEGRRDEIIEEVLGRIRFSLGTYILGMFGITFVAPWLLERIGSNISLPGMPATALYCCFGCYAKYFSLGQHITALGNQIVQYWERVAAAAIGVVLVAILMPRYGVLGIVVGFALPYPFLFRLRSIKLASEFLGIRMSRMLKIGIMPAAYIMLVLAYFLFLYPS